MKIEIEIIKDNTDETKDILVLSNTENNEECWLKIKGSIEEDKYAINIEELIIALRALKKLLEAQS